MTDTTGRARVARRSRHEAIRAEVAEEEAEAADVEVAEKAGTLECRCTCASTENWMPNCVSEPPQRRSPPPRGFGACSGKLYTSHVSPRRAHGG